MSNKTAEGLRDRLFDALDGLIEGKIDTKRVESICYVSEQIIKTAQVELELSREHTRQKEIEHKHTLELKQSERESIMLLGKTMESVGELDDVEIQ